MGTSIFLIFLYYYLVFIDKNKERNNEIEEDDVYAGCLYIGLKREESLSFFENEHVLHNCWLSTDAI